MKQLVFIHGGESFDTYDEYIAALKTWNYEPHKEHAKRWKNSLPEDLGEEWEVFMPTMPSKYNAKYLEWSIWFDKVVPYLKDDVVLIGHSQGGIFLAKYLCEHELPVRVRATFIISAPFDTEGTDYTLADFTLPASLNALSKRAGELHIWQAKDDEIVPFKAYEKYCAALPSASCRSFETGGHFVGEEFPQLIEAIRSL